MMSELAYVGQRVKRVDAFDKVTGKGKYVGDIKMEGMLYGKILRSPVAHGIVKKIDVTKAKALPGVVAVITYEDVPKIPYTTTGHPYPEDTPLDTLILAKHVRYIGDPIAAVAAETLEIAQKAIDLIGLDIEPLPIYLTPEESLKENAVAIHAGSGNIADSHSYEEGDVEAGFKASDLIFEDEIKVPIVQHVPIEPAISLSYLDNDGTVVIHSANQGPHLMRKTVSKALGLPIEGVRVIKTLVGGGFGAKQDAVLEPLNGALAIAAKRPVLLEFTREESIQATRTRHSMTFKLKTGVNKDGKIIARSMNVVSNTGAYSAHGHSVCGNIGGQFSVLYPAKNLYYKATTVYTNILIASAMRGYGIPQLAFAVESHMENIAHKMKWDPILFREKNLCKCGDYNNVNGFEIQSCGLPEIIAKGKEAIDWDNSRKEEKERDGKYYGVGMALFSYFQSTFPHSVELSGARVIMNENGSATLHIGCAEIGQGTDTVMAQICAEAIGISVDKVKVVGVDTLISPFDCGAYASRQTYVSGMAVKKAGLKCRKVILKKAAQLLDRDKKTLKTRDNEILDNKTGEVLLSVEDVVMKIFYDQKSSRTLTKEAYYSPKTNALTFGAAFTKIVIDKGTGKVVIDKIVAVIDSGKIINPDLAEGQVEGGTAMSIAYGLLEEILIDEKTGKVRNGNLLDYKIPTMMDIPSVDVHFIETEEPTSAYGNKSLGEPPNIAPAVALRNAVLDCTDIPFNRLPMTAERIQLALLEKNRE